MLIGVALALAATAAVLVLGLATGAFNAPFVALVQAHFDRPIHVGSLRLQLWSRRIVAQQVTIGNPPWVAAGDMARIERLTLVFGAPGFGGDALESIVAQGATLHLLRDATGHANWQLFDPDSGRFGKGLPLIRELLAPETHLELDDQQRHLQFDGIVSAQGPAEPSRLHIHGEGQLNGRPANIELSGDPLGGVHRDTPYACEFTEQSGGTRVDLRGSLAQPFDFKVMDGSFEAAGPDLKDLHYLTGLTLLHTGAYRLTGSIARRGTGTRLEQLHLTTGQSEVAGSLSSQRQGGAVNGRPLLEATVTAGVVHLADFGAHAAGRSTGGGASRADASAVTAADVAAPPVFSDAALNTAGLRRIDAQVRFEATRVDVGRTAVHSLSGQMKIDHGVLTISAMRGEVMQGKFEASLKLDASREVPLADVTVSLHDLQLASLGDGQSQEDAPLNGLLQARIDMTGHGASLHQIAASANGAVSMTLPHGTIRASLAEMAGLDLRGLGLSVTRSTRETTVRCAAATFQAHDGALTAQSIVIDTDPVLIRGEGVIHLDTESLDIVLRGEPKYVRVLRVDAPLRLRGTLMRPSVAIQAHDSSVKFIDPGHGKNVDCASLLSAPQS